VSSDSLLSPGFCRVVQQAGGSNAAPETMLEFQFREIRIYLSTRNLLPQLPHQQGFLAFYRSAERETHHVAPTLIRRADGVACTRRHRADLNQIGHHREFQVLLGERVSTGMVVREHSGRKLTPKSGGDYDLVRPPGRHTKEKVSVGRECETMLQRLSSKDPLHR
jgi:hypothetical protein